MGEIEAQLAAVADRLMQLEAHQGLGVAARSSLRHEIFGIFAGAADAQDAEAVAEWRDETNVTLASGEPAEWKVVMDAGQSGEYLGAVTGGPGNFDLHGHSGGQSVTLQKGPWV